MISRHHFLTKLNITTSNYLLNFNQQSLAKFKPNLSPHQAQPKPEFCGKVPIATIPIIINNNNNFKKLLKIIYYNYSLLLKLFKIIKICFFYKKLHC